MNQLRSIRALYLGAALALPCAIGHAQQLATEINPHLDSTVKAEKARNSANAATIELRNIPSSLMAYWLDPAHQPMPIQLQSSLSSEFPHRDFINDLSRQPGDARGPLGLKLPAGVDLIASIDPENALLARGTDAGIEELRKLVALHDIPIKQTEIEAQLFDMPLADLNALKIPFRWTQTDAKDTSWPAIGFTSGDMTERLNALMVAERTRLITAPRMTLMNGLSGRVVSTEIRPIELRETKTIKEARAAMLASDDKWREGSTLVSDETGVYARAVAKGDLIAMELQFVFMNQATRFDSIVRDGQTLVVLLPQSGNSAPRRRVASLGDISIAPQKDKDTAKSQTVRVIFVTVRSIRRAGEPEKN